ncbi:MAG: endonuclease/exonuclease/phosphatase family protein [Planctomycetaceae bacterium]
MPLFQLVIFLFALNLASRLQAQPTAEDVRTIRVMTFNILQGGNDAGNVGFGNMKFGGSRIDEIAEVIKVAGADIVGVQEDCDDDRLRVALGNDWHRKGSIYSRFPLSDATVKPYLTVVRVQLTEAHFVNVVNCHWLPPANGYGPDVVQAELRKGGPIDAVKLAELAVSRCRVADGPRGYNRTLDLLKPFVDAGTTVLLTGDFNEPSHLDWTAADAEKGTDRWVRNPTAVPLRFAIEWPGSKALENLGMIDSYRSIHTNEVAKRGITWTPSYEPGTPGRRPYDDQCLDRIDRIYHFGSSCHPVAAEVVGENEKDADIVPKCLWPSDHRAVVVEYSIKMTNSSSSGVSQ